MPRTLGICCWNRFEMLSLLWWTRWNMEQSIWKLSSDRWWTHNY